MRKPIIAGNWKMNNTASEGVALVKAIAPLVTEANCDVVVCVPAINIPAVSEAIKGTNIKLGAENVTRGAIAFTSATPSEAVLFIFQLPAMIGFLMVYTPISKFNFLLKHIYASQYIVVFPRLLVAYPQYAPCEVLNTSCLACISAFYIFIYYATEGRNLSALALLKIILYRSNKRYREELYLRRVRGKRRHR